MTNNTSDDELRRKINCYLGYCLPNKHECLYEESRNDSQEVDMIMQLIKQRDEQVALKASMQTQFFLMSDLLLEMGPLMVHKHEPGFPEMTAEIIGKVADWRNDKFDEAVKVVIPGKDK